MIRNSILLLAVAVSCCLVPSAQAQAKLNLPVAKAAYDAGKASGITPQTKGENRLCAAYWDVMHFMRGRDILAEADWQYLGPDFDAAPMLIRKVGFKLAAGEGDYVSDAFKRASEAALDRFQGFVEGDEEMTRHLFENLGVCQRDFERDR